MEINLLDATLNARGGASSGVAICCLVLAACGATPAPEVPLAASSAPPAAPVVVAVAKAAPREDSSVITEAFLAQCLGGVYEPYGRDLANGSFKVPVGAEHVAGLSAALQATR